MSALVQIMASRWPGNKPFCEPMVVNLLAQISSLGLNELCIRFMLNKFALFCNIMFSLVYSIINTTTSVQKNPTLNKSNEHSNFAVH